MLLATLDITGFTRLIRSWLLLKSSSFTTTIPEWGSGQGGDDDLGLRFSPKSSPNQADFQSPSCVLFRSFSVTGETHLAIVVPAILAVVSTPPHIGRCIWLAVTGGRSGSS